MPAAARRAPKSPHPAASPAGTLAGWVRRAAPPAAAPPEGAGSPRKRQRPGAAPAAAAATAGEPAGGGQRQKRSRTAAAAGEVIDLDSVVQLDEDSGCAAPPAAAAAAAPAPAGDGDGPATPGPAAGAVAPADSAAFSFGTPGADSPSPAAPRSPPRSAPSPAAPRRSPPGEAAPLPPPPLPQQAAAAAAPTPTEAQRVDPPAKEGELHTVRNSPHGAARTGLGWGTVFVPAPLAVPHDTRIHVGTSSLNCLPKRVARSGFAGQIVEYARKFRTLEHCAPYHKVPPDETWRQWGAAAAKASPRFRITVKASKWLTHERMLACTSGDVREHVIDFAGRCRLLGPALSAVLVQLPPSMPLRPDLGDCLDALADALQAEARTAGPSAQPVRLAFELRSPALRQEVVYAALRRHNWACVVSDLAGGLAAAIDTSTDLAYFRLNGSMGRFVGDYGPAVCEHYASLARELARSGKEVYVFFNNNESAAGGLPSSVADATCFALKV
eukprot:TRINITY_DN6843_c0_g2_i1.p1 TRINITY_DN6843_c0_g2~~TRINITY_DN6843_c0_g2_i1.p1  ORF type:complete len:521 (+),score=160.16 TRINITY_DN6843_c0_g2_i1:68-1564(+)